MQAICLACDKHFKYNKSSKTGKYCSRKCNGAHKKRLYKEQWYLGKLAHLDRNTIRRYLTEDRGYQCAVCGLNEWLDKIITLHVDHINGDPGNDNPNNVRLICPNCHSQTLFLGAANKGRGRKSQGLPLY
ncbi:MAG: HNH endonuclease signature motif containing protein [Nitrosopumilaceae archaeon]